MSYFGKIKLISIVLKICFKTYSGELTIWTRKQIKVRHPIFIFDAHH